MTPIRNTQKTLLPDSTPDWVSKFKSLKHELLEKIACYSQSCQQNDLQLDYQNRGSQTYFCSVHAYFSNQAEDHFVC